MRRGGQSWVYASLCALLFGSLLVVSPAANAGHDDALVSPNPVAGTPHVLGAATNAERVFDVAEFGDLLVVVGRFTEVRNVGGDVLSRPYAYAFDIETGLIDPHFAPQFDGQVNSVAVTPDGHLLFGGEFEFVGDDRSRHLVKLDRYGQVVDGFRVIPNRRVVQIEVVGQTAYLAGAFFRVDNIDRELVAAIDAVTGELGDLSLDFEEPRDTIGIKPELVIRALDVSDDGTTMVVGGGFNRVDGERRSYLAVIDLVERRLSPWYSSAYEAECSGRRQQTPIWDVDIDRGGEFFVVVTTGFTADEPDGLCDAAARFELDATAPDVEPTWVNWTNGDSLTAVEITEATVYVGGHMRWVNGLDVPGDRSENIDRPGLAALDPRNGVPLTWRAERQPRGGGVWELLATERGLWVGSDTDYVSGEYRGKLALLPWEGGTAVPRTWTPTLPATLSSFTQSSGDGGEDHGSTSAITSRPFDGTTVEMSAEVVADSVGRLMPIGAATRIGDVVVFTRADTHIIGAADFDGTILGPARALDPVGKNPRQWPLAQISGMFFDHRFGRLYYTVAGDDRLRYRGFAPESELFSPKRVFVDTGPFPWGSVRGMEFVGDRLYLGDADGRVRSYVVDESFRPAVETVIDHGLLHDAEGSAGHAFFLGSPPGEPGMVTSLVEAPPGLRFTVDIEGGGPTVSRPVHLEAGVDTLVSLRTDDPSADVRLYVTDADGATVMSERSRTTDRLFRLRATTTGEHDVSVRSETGSTRVRVAVGATTIDAPDIDHRLIGRWTGRGDPAVQRWNPVVVDLQAGRTVDVDLSWVDADQPVALFVQDPEGATVLRVQDGQGQASASFVPSVSGRHRLAVSLLGGPTDYTLRAVQENRAPTAPATANVSTTAGQLTAITVIATDLDGDHLRFSATGLPPGVSIDQAGTVSGETAGIGTWDATIVARDDYGGEITTRLRWVSALPDHVIETGLVQIDNDRSGDWLPVIFDQTFAYTPVVVVGPPGFRDPDPAVVRVRNVTPFGFEMALQDWAGPRRDHLAEDVAWLAVLPGTRSLGDLDVFVGRFDTDHEHDHAPFEHPFDGPPVVLATVQTREDTRQVTTRIDDLTATGFDVRLSSAEEETDPSRSEEVVGFIAIERGSTIVDGRPFTIGSAVINQDPYIVDAAGLGGTPMLFATILDDRGIDNAAVRYRTTEGTPVEIWIEEDTTLDEETEHIREEVGWLVIGPPA